jgi:hypothetical protein
MSDLNEFNEWLRGRGLPVITVGMAGSELLSITRTAANQAWFEEKILQLTLLCSPYQMTEVDRLFKEWYRSTCFPLPFAMDHCLDRARRGLSLPWEKAATPSAPKTNSSETL